MGAVIAFPRRQPTISIGRDPDGTFAVIPEAYASTLATERGWLLEARRCVG
jgi:hypothetical protein